MNPIAVWIIASFANLLLWGVLLFVKKTDLRVIQLISFILFVAADVMYFFFPNAYAEMWRMQDIAGILIDTAMCACLMRYELKDAAYLLPYLYAGLAFIKILEWDRAESSMPELANIIYVNRAIIMIVTTLMCAGSLYYGFIGEHMKKKPVPPVKPKPNDGTLPPPPKQPGPH